MTQIYSPEIGKESAGSPWRVLPIVLTGTFMAILDTFIVFVAAPSIQAGLHASSAQVQFIVAGYQVMYSVTLITGARLGDIYGRKRLFMIGMAVFTVASALCAASPDPAALIGSRLVQGVGAGLMFPQVFSIIQVLLPPQERHKAFGVLGAVIGVSGVVGQVVGGLLISADLFGTTWRPVFWVNVPIGVAALVLAARRVPESKSPEVRTLDLAGVTVLSVVLSLLIIPLIQGRQSGWPLWTWLCLGGSAVAFAVFALVENRVKARGRSPLVELRMFRQRSFAVGMGLVLITYLGVNSFFLILSLMLQDGLSLSALGAGGTSAPLAAAFFGCSLLAGKLTPRYGRRVLEVGAVVAAIGFIGTYAVASSSGGQLTVARMMPALVVVGTGNGLLLPPLLNAVLARIGPSEMGIASGVLSTAQQVGGALGVAISGLLYFNALGHTATHDVAGYAHALSVAVLFNLAIDVVAFGLLFALPEAKPASR